MIRHCDGTDLNLIRWVEGGEIPCNCGATFDDVDWTVIYPHQEVHGSRTLSSPISELSPQRSGQQVVILSSVDWETNTSTVTRAYFDAGAPRKAAYIPDVNWRWLKWTFGFWIDPKNHTYFGIDFGPLEIVWHSEGYKP